MVRLGGVHYRRLRLLNMLVGGKLAAEPPPTAFGLAGRGRGDAEMGPLVTVVGVHAGARGRSNYGAS